MASLPRSVHRYTLIMHLQPGRSVSKRRAVSCSSVVAHSQRLVPVLCPAWRWGEMNGGSGRMMLMDKIRWIDPAIVRIVVSKPQMNKFVKLNWLAECEHFRKSTSSN